MTIPITAIGKVYTANEISIGSTTGTAPVTFTETKLLSDQVVLGTPIGAAAKVTITAVSTPDANGVQTISAVIGNSPAAFANGQVVTGTTLGNDSTDFIITGSAGGLSGTFFITNLPTQQPGVGNTATVQPPGARVPYTPACYCAGTLIRTERGDVPVEALSIGDRVVTATGAAEPIRWIGTRSYAGRFLAARNDPLPVRFRAGSISDGVPARDLLVSPKHAMFLDGMLIAAELLVNGATIVREQAAARVDYVHLELAQHSIIWAEGAASETYVDDDNRAVFHNAHTYGELYPAAELGPAQYCAPRVTEGFKLEAIRARLGSRADLAA